QLAWGARAGFVGLSRDEKTRELVDYYVKLPQDIAERDVLLLDPMLATGHSTAYATRLVKEAGAASVRLIALIAAPGGAGHTQPEPPDGAIIAPASGRQLNEKGYIMPGLGDAGDRLFGTR